MEGEGVRCPDDGACFDVDLAADAQEVQVGSPFDFSLVQHLLYRVAIILCGIAVLPQFPFPKFLHEAVVVAYTRGVRYASWARLIVWSAIGLCFNAIVCPPNQLMPPSIYRVFIVFIFWVRIPLLNMQESVADCVLPDALSNLKGQSQ